MEYYIERIYTLLLSRKTTIDDIWTIYDRLYKCEQQANPNKPRTCFIKKTFDFVNTYRVR